MTFTFLVLFYKFYVILIFFKLGESSMKTILSLFIFAAVSLYSICQSLTPTCPCYGCLADNATYPVPLYRSGTGLAVQNNNGTLTSFAKFPGDLYYAMAVSADGKTLGALNGTANTLEIYNTNFNPAAPLIPVTPTFSSSLSLPSGIGDVITNSTHTIRFQNNDPVAPYPGYLISSMGLSQVLSVGFIQLGSPYSNGVCLALSPDNTQVLVGTNNGTVLAYDLTVSASPQFSIHTGLSTVDAVIYSALGNAYAFQFSTGQYAALDLVHGGPSTPRTFPGTVITDIIGTAYTQGPYDFAIGIANDTYVTTFNLTLGTSNQQFNVGNPLVALAIDPNLQDFYVYASPYILHYCYGNPNTQYFYAVQNIADSTPFTYAIQPQFNQTPLLYNSSSNASAAAP